MLVRVCVSAVPVMGVGPRQEVQEIQLKVCKEGFFIDVLHGAENTAM